MREYSESLKRKVEGNRNMSEKELAEMTGVSKSFKSFVESMVFNTAGSWNITNEVSDMSEIEDWLDRQDSNCPKARHVRGMLIEHLVFEGISIDKKWGSRKSFHTTKEEDEIEMMCATVAEAFEEGRKYARV